MYGNVSRLASIALLAAALAGCSAVDRVSNIGKAPDFAPIASPATTVSMPMPEPEQVVYQPNSLWRSGSRAFFRDQRAARVGDILTVLIGIADSAKVNNSTKRSRANAEDAELGNLFGYENYLGKVFPDGVDKDNLARLGSTSSSAGTGSVDRKESIDLTVAAVVTQVLPNGNLVIAGRQQVRVNYEVRDLEVTGIVRPEDISNTNTIAHTQIAEARIAYGGQGQISDVQQPRYGQQLFDIVMPF
ncbi:flagellar basal body L-ring protein FlgH [Parvibaculum sp.]|uniref:flagellar basal body L-ring protein FlgH n=1 Tax=Parvibaculum sp. TaxID=2024848 RepID=UPI00272F89E3|nr:flagellar basal body L-ring protein FlgH [Parvibaculum sp.]MDP1627106.1 flagellar basal body L-ring protein FlgH [Parvibaculum sp.]MDP2149303.1 flagellar basal body L-ring protein FlgH [Parvibaculum sp.]MDP3328127.1 flagellar basal body L-ring protein FlgH [Parvibaculum sp.]